MNSVNTTSGRTQSIKRERIARLVMPCIGASSRGVCPGGQGSALFTAGRLQLILEDLDQFEFVAEVFPCQGMIGVDGDAFVGHLDHGHLELFTVVIGEL